MKMTQLRCFLVMGSFDKKCNDNHEVEESESEELCLKLHRLGRTCFRKVRFYIGI